MIKNTIFLIALATLSARAQNNLDRCDDILKQDLFNKVTSSSQASASEKAAFEEKLFSMSSTDAYAQYDKAYKSGQVQKTKGAGEGHYGVGGGSFSFAHTYDRELSESEFTNAFNQAKSERQSSSSSSNSKDASLISLYKSSVRDAGSVKAWETCMTSKYPEPGLFSYGYRDPGGRPYIVVMWAPGAFAAANPVVNVKLGVTDPGITVEGGAGELHIAAGSGAAFPVRFSNPKDSKALAEGFAILVNGELKSAGRLVQSFRSEAIVPRVLGPVPCSAVFSANQNYQIGVVDSRTGETHWVTDISVKDSYIPLRHGERRDSPPPQNPTPLAPAADDTMHYHAMMGTGARASTVSLRLAGTNVIFDDGKISGTCSGQGVHLRMAIGATAIEWPDIVFRSR